VERSLNEHEKKDFWRNETIAFLALASIKGVGYWKLHKIAESGKSYKELLKAESATELSKLLKIDLSIELPWEEYQVQLWSMGLEQARSLHNQDIRLLFREQDHFPLSLKHIKDAPHWLFVQGVLENLNVISVSVVGTRKPSEDGILLTKIAIAGLVGRGIPTVSGLASGIDQTVHIDSLRYGIPTVAVLGNGLFVEYPKGSDTLKRKILEYGGTVVSEYLPTQMYSAENFVRRNRIQAALCDTLIPVEWKIKSGTAHTVNFAIDFNKKIAGIFLPCTHLNRPELQFAESCGGRSFELPEQIQQLLSYILNEEKSDQTSQHSLDL
jgi:DNA processing protein